ncbi:MAG TPA: adenylate/guanylate cyclase domain-containing protein [Mycobacteriales bacterium]|nr:adenylate/guanylate cyclase domain-containing protein [Mycobacteriales bacterium]
MFACDGTTELTERVGRRITVRVPTAHLAGALLAAGSGALTAAHLKGQIGFTQVDAITLAGYLALTGPLGVWSGRRMFRRATAWLDSQREPTDDDLRALLRLPAHYAVQGMIGWFGAVVIWTGLSAVSHPWQSTVRVAMSIWLGGLTTCGLTYLIAEWAIRPLVAVGLAGRALERRLAPGVWTKLLLSWVVGADVFLLMIGLTFVGRPSSQPPSAAAIWFIIGAAFIAGSLVVHVATRSLATPLLGLRSAVRQVQNGELDVAIPVDDGGEIGMLQAGFNQMVAGLRERAVLSDLFGRHVGVDVAREAIAAGNVVLGGERREVGVVFVDVIGSTKLAQTQAPEDVVALLNQFFGTVVRVVSSEGGWVNKFEGDGALAVFGAPAATDDCAGRALRAARTLRRELLAIAAAHPEIDAAIGVSAGTVVAGNIGAEERFEYTVVGSPVNEAARLTDEAKGRLGRVLASEEAVARAGGEAASWSVREEIRLRGYDDAVLVYEPADSARQPAASDA